MTEFDRQAPKLADRSAWIDARKALLAEEKAFNAARDRLRQARAALPMVRVERPYRFRTVRGDETLPDLFGGCGQLIVYHFMFGADWAEGCPSCSFWADNFDGIDVHLAARDTALVFVSTAPLATLSAYRARMGWRFDWVSSGGSDFNRDFGVTFEPGDLGPTRGYNYSPLTPAEEMPGLSVFQRLEDGDVAHSYSTYARGLDMLNGAYHLLDLTPKGRDESGLAFPQAWVRRRDRYDAEA